MGLRKINRDRVGGKSLGSIFSFGRKKHFQKLGKRKLHGEEPRGETPKRDKGDGYLHPRKKPLKKKKNKWIPITLIILIAISVIAVEVMLWTQKEKPETIVPAINETNETNETNQTPLTVNETPEVPKPDLDVRSLTLSSSEADIGDVVTITAEVKNKGDANASNVAVSFSMGELDIGSHTIPQILADETVTVSANWTAIEEAVGEYDVTAIADPGDEIEEERENNNEENEGITVNEKEVIDVTALFKNRANNTREGEFWYSHNSTWNRILLAGGGESYQYFDISRGEDSDEFYLTVVVPGFKIVRMAGVAGVYIPDSDDGLWDSRHCLRESQDSEDCIWNGPEIRIDLSFDNNRLVATDRNGVESGDRTYDNSIDSVKLVGLKTAEWPGELKTWKVMNGPSPDHLVPLDFYDVVNGRKIHIYPMRWNPTSRNAQVGVWFRFKITVD